jgi:two-component system nitrate/nitrite sensor histidine kinase NarX
MKMTIPVTVKGMQIMPLSPKPNAIPKKTKRQIKQSDRAQTIPNARIPSNVAKNTSGAKNSEQPSFEENGQYRSIFNAANDGLIIHDLETGVVVKANTAACKMHGYTREAFIGLPLTAFIDPDSWPIFNEYLHIVRSKGNLFDIRTLHKRSDGSTFYAEWRGTAITYQGRLCLMGMVRDISERVRVEQSLLQDAQTHAHEQAILLELSYTLASTLEFRPGLILEQLHEMIRYTHGAFFSIEASTLVTLAMRGTKQLEQSAPIHIPLNIPETLVILFNEHQPIRIADIWSDDPHAQFLRSLVAEDATVLLEGMYSWMWVPLAVRGRLIGGMALSESKKKYFTPHHADLALRVANQAAITMINAELYRQAQMLAVSEERQRLARNLHDAVNQSLFSAGLIAEVLPRLWDRDQEEARRSLQDLRRLTRGAQAEMRALLAELRPSTLTDSSLGDLLSLLGNALSGRINIPVTVTVNGEFTLPAKVQIAFYRVCQEALYNIAKHAKASQVEINLDKAGSIIELHIHDNGLGFDPAQTFSGHYGLSMMREHAEAVQALLSITSQPGEGTDLTIRWTKASTQDAL